MKPFTLSWLLTYSLLHASCALPNLYLHFSIFKSQVSEMVNPSCLGMNDLLLRKQL